MRTYPLRITQEQGEHADRIYSVACAWVGPPAREFDRAELMRDYAIQTIHDIRDAGHAATVYFDPWIDLPNQIGPELHRACSDDWPSVQARRAVAELNRIGMLPGDVDRIAAALAIDRVSDLPALVQVANRCTAALCALTDHGDLGNG